MQIQSWEKESFIISTDPKLLDLDRVHGSLSAAYWSEGIPKAIVEKALSNSLCFGVYERGVDMPSGLRQIGLARAISDYATFAYLCDVYIEQAYRGRGLSKWLMKCVMDHPELQGLRRFSLATKDAHGLYRQFGFKVTETPDRWMEIRDPDVYKRS